MDDAFEADLCRYATRLRERAESALASSRDRGLSEELLAVRTTLESLGPRLSGSTATLLRREEYLADAVHRVEEALARMTVGLEAPGELDLSVRVGHAREAIAYLADITAELVPPAVYRGICPGLMDDIADDVRVPELAGLLVPVSMLLLRRIRRACELAEEISRGAGSVLAETPPAYAPATSDMRTRQAEIDDLIAMFGVRRAEQPAARRGRSLGAALARVPAPLARLLAESIVTEPDG